MVLAPPQRYTFLETRLEPTIEVPLAIHHFAVEERERNGSSENAGVK